MLQARVIFDLLFHRGIGPTNNKNQNYFSEIENCSPTEEGFIGARNKGYSFQVLEGVDNQVFNISFDSYIFTPEKIYKVVGNELELEMEGIEVGEKWSKAEYEGFTLFGNGKKVIILDSLGIFAYSQDIPVCKDMVNFNGQLILSNHTLDVNNFIPAVLPSLDLGKSLLLHSGIGNINCIPSDTNPEAGFLFLFEVGEILKSFNFDNGILVVGTKGVVMLNPFELGFGKRLILEHGAIDRDNVSGGNTEVVFKSQDGSIWGIRKDLKVTLYGFKYLFKDLSIKIFYDTSREEFCFLTPTKTYVLGGSGLFSLNGLLTGKIGKEVDGKFLASSLPDLGIARCITSVLDFKDPGLKIIEEVSVGIETEDPDLIVSFCIWTREKINGPWFQSPFYRLNDQNVCKPHVAGSEFKVEFKCSSFSNFKLDWLTVQYDKIDKRVNRGHQFVDINKEG